MADGILFALDLRMQETKHFVYVLKSPHVTDRYYVGLTANVSARLESHNAGQCLHTARYRPWFLHVTIEFVDEPTAVHFERYLKSGSGRAFARRHFESPVAAKDDSLTKKAEGLE